MAYLIRCPSCEQDGLDPKQDQPECLHCHAVFRIERQCPVCHQTLAKLQACGAVDFFCNQCNNLVSKRQAEYVLTAVQAEKDD